MATLTGYNTLRSFIGDYNSFRASNVSYFQGWEGDTYFFEKRYVYEGRTFTALRMEVEGSDLVAGSDALSGTVNTVRLIDFNNRADAPHPRIEEAEITGLSLDGQTLAYLMRWAQLGDNRIQWELFGTLQNAITTQIARLPDGWNGELPVRLSEYYMPERIILDDIYRVEISDAELFDRLEVIGTASVDIVEIAYAADGTLVNLNEVGGTDDQFRLITRDIEEIHVGQGGVTVIGKDDAPDKIILTYSTNRPSATVVDGGGEADEIVGAHGTDQLQGGGGADRLFGHGGNDILEGGNDNDRLFGHDGNDILNGGMGQDFLSGGAGIDILYGDGGWDVINGGTGNDVLFAGSSMRDIGNADRAQYGGLASEYVIMGGHDYAVVIHQNGDRDKLFGFHSIEFEDRIVELEEGSALEGVGDPEDFSRAERIVLLYEAAFDREGDIDLLGLNHYVARAETTGLPDAALAWEFMHSPEFENNFGDIETMSNSDFLTLIYQNVLDREPDPAGLSFYLDLLNFWYITKEEALADIAISPENAQGSVETLTSLYQTTSGDWAFLA